ncbi:isoleucine--tRNA ligase [Candidatus Margulisiibacteriota bacterium]
MRANLAQREPDIIKIWEESDIYKLSLGKNKDAQEFILHDGPPYPNGNIHAGHALNKIIKDIVVKYKTMKGYYAPFIPGWDCHGLPIETQLLKEIKKNKEPVPSNEEFRERCKQYSLNYVDIQKAQFKRLGVRADWDNPYLTLNEDYENNVFELFNQLYKKGYVYQGRKPIHWCCNCKTALAEAEIEYSDAKSPSIYTKFQVINGGVIEQQDATPKKQVNFMVWTTTPWTLPANVAVAVHPKFNYALIEHESMLWIVVEELVEAVMQKLGWTDYKIQKTIIGRDLEGTISKHPFYDREAPIVCAEYVTAEDGTGCVHIAPGHGQEDHVVGKEYELPMIMPVDDAGVLTEEAGQFAGLNVHEANKAIVAHMEAIGTLLKLEMVKHSYPHCWRCHQPVIFRATEQWFIAVDHNDLRKRALKEIKKTKWVPEWGIKRINGMVDNRPDWCISRQRIWGLKIPLEGINDIMDVWLESGASWATLLGKKQADLYLEGSDQHRGWFQSSLLLSVALNDQAPYKAVLTHGFTVDDKGRKMSKSMGNVVDPLKVIKQYGADILRLWVVSSQFKDDMSISDKLLRQVADVYGKIRNTWRFLISNIYDYQNQQDQLTELDRWILMRLQHLVASVEKAYEEYDYHKIYHAVHNYCANDLSSFYLDMVKDRLYCDAKDSLSRRSTQTALNIVLNTLLKIMTPILSFTTEEVWGFLNPGSASIQLEDFPAVNPDYMDSALEQKWEQIFELRAQVYQKIEEARQAKLIAGSLDAKVELTVSQKLNISSEDLAVVFIVSQVEIKEGKEQIVVVSHADGEKCERCWKWAELTNGVCSRCQEVVKCLS